MQRLVLLAGFAMSVPAAWLHADGQGASQAPGQFDFYMLNVAWSPEFCSTLDTLTPAEKAARASSECSAPHAFVVHGLWPQNTDGTYPSNCSTRPGPRNWDKYLSLTPDVDLLKHEWFKHGTCTTLSPAAFFSTARQAFTSIVIPAEFERLNQATTMTPGAILDLFSKANPSFPKGSFAVACSNQKFTAIEACFSKEGVQPVACRGVNTCREATLTVEPEPGGQIVR